MKVVSYLVGAVALWFFSVAGIWTPAFGQNHDEPCIVAVDGEVEPAPGVLHFSASEAVEIFRNAEFPEDHPTNEEAFPIAFPTKPQALVDVTTGSRLVAGVEGDQGSSWLRERGLLVEVLRTRHSNDQWIMDVKNIGLEDIIQDGELRVTVSAAMRSTDLWEGEGWQRVRSDALIESSPTPAVTMAAHQAAPYTHGSPLAACDRQTIASQADATITFLSGNTSVVEADFSYVIVLVLERTWRFAGRRLTEATVDASVCKESRIGLKSERIESPATIALWDRPIRRRVVMAGWLPVSVGGRVSLQYTAPVSTRIESRPLVEAGFAVGGRAELAHGDWTWAQIPGFRTVEPHINFPRPYPTVEAELKQILEPRLEVELYGLFGPFVGAPANMSLAVDSSARWTSSLGLTLNGGIFYPGPQGRDIRNFPLFQIQIPRSEGAPGNVSSE